MSEDWSSGDPFADPNDPAAREREELERGMLAEVEELQRRTVHPEDLRLEPVVVTPTSRDVAVRYLGLVWVPFARREERWERA